MENKEKEYIYYRESLWSSIASDLFTFGMLALVFAFNYFYLGDSLAGAIILFIMLLMIVYARGSSKRKVFTDKDELLDYLYKN